MKKNSRHSLKAALTQMGPANLFFAFVLFFCLLITFPIVIAVVNPFTLSEKAMATGLVLFLCLYTSLAFYFKTFKQAAWATLSTARAKNPMLLLALIYLTTFGIYAVTALPAGNIHLFSFKSSLTHLGVSGILCAVVMNRTHALANNASS